MRMEQATVTTHHFVPQRYYSTIGWHEPVLRIAPGDRVVTTTVNSRGWDVNEEHVALGGNPQTGPFFIEGAEAGDTLVITIERITPNRPRGYAANVVSANVVDPEFVRELPPRQTVYWSVDVEHGFVAPLDASG